MEDILFVFERWFRAQQLETFLYSPYVLALVCISFLIVYPVSRAVCGPIIPIYLHQWIWVVHLLIPVSFMYLVEYVMSGVHQLRSTSLLVMPMAAGWRLSILFEYLRPLKSLSNMFVFIEIWWCSDSLLLVLWSSLVGYLCDKFPFS